MGPGREGRRRPEEQSAAALAQAILQRIADGDLPNGTELDPERLAAIFGSTPALAAGALEQLEDAGATVRIGDSWMVRIDRVVADRELLNRLGPLFRAVTSLAAGRITAAEAAGLLAAYDRAAGLAGDGSARSRTEGYALFMRRLVAASASSFHEAATETILAETESLQEIFLERRQNEPLVQGGGPMDELARLARALMARDEAAACEAADDHLIIIARHLDCYEAR
jgi:DNA-binding GntR family transcriptional regulator